MLDNDGETDGAVQEYREAIRLQPTNADAHYNLAISLARKHDGTGAVTELREAEKLDPDWELPHIQLMTLLMETDPKTALDECRIAERLTHDARISQLCTGIATEEEWNKSLATNVVNSLVESVGDQPMLTLIIDALAQRNPQLLTELDAAIHEKRRGQVEP